MAVNLSSLAPITTGATALSNLILVSPQATVGYQPQNPPNADGTPSQSQNPPAFLFNYEGEQSATLTSDITDHYVEDNTAVQDQIALKPELITTHGFIGELNDVVPPALALLKTAADKLTTIVGYTPQLTETALLAYSEALLVYETATTVANAAVSAWSSVGNAVSGSDGQSVIGSQGLVASENQNKQQQAFQAFYGYWKKRILFTVQTPWAVFQNMAIQSLRVIQDADTRMISDFELTFKMIRTAASITVAGGFPISYAGRLNSQTATQTDLGTSSPAASTSLGSGLASMGVA